MWTDANFTTKIELAEITRENGDSVGATALLTEVITAAKTLEKIEFLACALGHRIVCRKHLFQNTGKMEYLVNMEIDVMQGLALLIPEQEKAIFHLRHGDALMLRKDFAQAGESYKTAHILEKQKGNTAATAEYLGHWAEAIAKNGNAKLAIAMLQDALQLLSGATTAPLRKFHKQVVVSGIKFRMVKPAVESKQYKLATCSFAHGYYLAWVLCLWHNMPQRLKQCHKALFKH